MKQLYRRRHLFVHPIQYWFVVTTLIYFSFLLVVLYGVVFLPMVQSLDDPSVSWHERVRVANQFLEFNGRVWPWILVAFLVLLLHSIYFMHRIAGPLYRFKSLFRAIGGGDLFVRAKLRQHDYLHQEADCLNTMLNLLEQRVQQLNSHCLAVGSAYEEARRLIEQGSGSRLPTALQALEDEIQDFKARINEFKVHGEPAEDGHLPSEQPQVAPIGAHRSMSPDGT